ncbi:hypothetical protein [Actinosynnema sp. NPDC023587]|uniref:hypothetical protein n=1 Tax=Actinosynnema sp. NPDC023587 TaxID=3154695 RepID=UPI003401E033
MLGTGIASAQENVNPDAPPPPLDALLQMPLKVDDNALGTPAGDRAPEIDQQVGARSAPHAPTNPLVRDAQHRVNPLDTSRATRGIGADIDAVPPTQFCAGTFDAGTCEQATRKAGSPHPAGSIAGREFTAPHFDVVDVPDTGAALPRDFVAETIAKLRAQAGPAASPVGPLSGRPAHQRSLSAPPTANGDRGPGTGAVSGSVAGFPLHTPLDPAAVAEATTAPAASDAAPVTDDVRPGHEDAIQPAEGGAHAGGPAATLPVTLPVPGVTGHRDAPTGRALQTPTGGALTGGALTGGTLTGGTLTGGALDGEALAGEALAAPAVLPDHDVRVPDTDKIDLCGTGITEGALPGVGCEIDVESTTGIDGLVPGDLDELLAGLPVEESGEVGAAGDASANTSEDKVIKTGGPATTRDDIGKAHRNAVTAPTAVDRHALDRRAFDHRALHHRALDRRAHERQAPGTPLDPTGATGRLGPVTGNIFETATSGPGQVSGETARLLAGGVSDVVGGFVPQPGAPAVADQGPRGLVPQSEAHTPATPGVDHGGGALRSVAGGNVMTTRSRSLPTGDAPGTERAVPLQAFADVAADAAGSGVLPDTTPEALASVPAHLQPAALGGPAATAGPTGLAESAGDLSEDGPLAAQDLTALAGPRPTIHHVPMDVIDTATAAMLAEAARLSGADDAENAARAAELQGIDLPKSIDSLMASTEVPTLSSLDGLRSFGSLDRLSDLGVVRGLDPAALVDPAALADPASVTDTVQFPRLTELRGYQELVDPRALPVGGLPAAASVTDTVRLPKLPIDQLPLNELPLHLPELNRLPDPIRFDALPTTRFATSDAMTTEFTAPEFAKAGPPALPAVPALPDLTSPPKVGGVPDVSNLVDIRGLRRATTAVGQGLDLVQGPEGLGRVQAGLNHLRGQEALGRADLTPGLDHARGPEGLGRVQSRDGLGRLSGPEGLARVDQALAHAQGPEGIKRLDRLERAGAREVVNNLTDRMLHAATTRELPRLKSGVPVPSLVEERSFSGTLPLIGNSPALPSLPPLGARGPRRSLAPQLPVPAGLPLVLPLPGFAQPRQLTPDLPPLSVMKPKLNRVDGIGVPNPLAPERAYAPALAGLDAQTVFDALEDTAILPRI